MNRRLAIVIGLGIVLFVIAAATPRSDMHKASIFVPYTYYSPPTKSKVCVQVMFTKTDQEARDKCRGAIGCMIDSGREPILLIAPLPTSFNDDKRLIVLGHEMLHALGAWHD